MVSPEVNVVARVSSSPIVQFSSMSVVKLVLSNTLVASRRFLASISVIQFGMINRNWWWGSAGGGSDAAPWFGVSVGVDRRSC